VGRSEKKTDWLGNEYIQHYDDDGNEVGTSKEATSWLGDKYTQHYDAQGEESGTSKEATSWLGDKYTQHHDRDGEESGTSKADRTWLGDDYTQHYDADGNESGTSRRETDWLGNPYVETRSDAPTFDSTAAGDPSSAGGHASSAGGALPSGCALCILLALVGSCFLCARSLSRGTAPSYTPPPPAPSFTPSPPPPEPPARPDPGCSFPASTSFHLRAAPTGQRSGPELPAGTRVYPIAPTGVTRRNAVLFEVRVGDGRTGWMFLETARLPAACPWRR